MLTVTIADVSPDEAAAHYRRAGVSGTAVRCVGFTPRWGIEDGTQITFAAPSDHYAALVATRALLLTSGEECALVVGLLACNGAPALFYADGRHVVLS